MAFNDSLSEEFTQLATIEPTQLESKFMNRVRVDTTDHCEIYHFMRASNIEAVVGKARHAEFDLINQDYTDIPATMKYINVPLMVDNFDQARTSLNYKETIVKQIKAALGKQIDREVVSAFHASSATAITGSPTAMNDAAWQALDSDFTAIDLDGAERFAALSPGAKKDILNDANLTSKDYVIGQVKNSGELPNLYGFEPFTTNRLLVSAGSDRRNWFWEKTAVGIAKLKDIEIKVSDVPMRDGTLFVGKLWMAAAVINPTAVKYANILDA